VLTVIRFARHGISFGGFPARLPRVRDKAAGEVVG